MNLRQLQCFLAVAEQRHFTRAADRLHYVPLDHQLRDLRPASVGNLHFNPKSAEPRLIGRLADQWMRRLEVDASEIPIHEERLARQHPRTYEPRRANEQNSWWKN
ncbi:LysR family transcriptional regulator [Stenotrophomonas maltophilia]|jgi:DNA-binding transcriptional LysR family regulator|nr:LysR family transcriptional regulator [Stenotrophomonas maltophilia]HEL4259812.1 LysR family transcriptional regulator [Stenotrophomonas maltophilia]